MAREQSETTGETKARIPWGRRNTRQQQGRRTERRILTERGAVIHPNSGAGRIKDDGHDEDYLFEVKDTAAASFIVKAPEMQTLFRRACQQNKVGVLLVYFAEYGFTVECRLIPGGKEVI